jgi:hypothetical protein
MSVVVVVASLSACNGHSASMAAPSPDPASPVTAPTGSEQPAAFTDTVALDRGDRHSQRFCARAPAAGTIAYVVDGGKARLAVRLRGLRGPRLAGVAWSSGGLHGGEVIGSVRIDRRGRTEQRTVRFFHTPYYQHRGVGILLVTNADKVVARAEPCSY